MRISPTCERARWTKGAAAGYSSTAAATAHAAGARWPTAAPTPRPAGSPSAAGRHAPATGQAKYTGSRSPRRGSPLALVLAEPVLGAHPERHVLPPGVRVAGDVPVTARRAKVAAGHRQPLGGIEFFLADDRPLGADITVGRAGVLHAQSEPASGADRRGLARPAAGQHRQ